jgi:hypothetical protein
VANGKVNARIKARMSESDTDLERNYEIVKKYAHKKRVYLDKVLDEVFSEYVKNHGLGEENEQLKSSRDNDAMQKVSGN